MTYAVTGATGGLGSQAIHHLIQQGVLAGSIVALIRDDKKAEGLKKQGVVLRHADYNDQASVEKALKGVDRVLLVSGSDVGKRRAQHLAVIQAAKAAGVKQVVYTSLIQADTSINPLADEHRGTEADLKASSLDWVLVRNNWYTENYAGDLAGAKHSGVIASAVKTGRVGSALRTEYAEAAARVLAGNGHSKKTYELAGTPWNYQDLAAAASKALGRPVTYQTITEAEKKATLVGLGLPEGLAAFFAAVDTTIEAGSLAYTSGDLAALLGRKPLTLEEALKTLV